MAIAVDTILTNAARLLSDETNTTWGAGTLVAWLNEAQHRIAYAVPSASTKRADIPFTAASAEQDLPDDGIRILDLVGVRKVDKAALDREKPGWESDTAANQPTMWMPSEHNPHEFYVYPPHSGVGTHECEYSYTPPDVQVGDDISLHDHHAEPITDYIVARALSEDSDYAEPGRSEYYMQMYKDALGIK